MTGPDPLHHVMIPATQMATGSEATQTASNTTPHPVTPPLLLHWTPTFAAAEHLVTGPNPLQHVTIPATQMATGSDTTQTAPNATPHTVTPPHPPHPPHPTQPSTATLAAGQLVTGPDPLQHVTIPATQMATGSDTTQAAPNATPHTVTPPHPLHPTHPFTHTFAAGQLVTGRDPVQHVTTPATQIAIGSNTTQAVPNATPHPLPLSPNAVEEAIIFFRRRAVEFRPCPMAALCRLKGVGSAGTIPRYLPQPVVQHPRPDVILAVSAMNEAIQAANTNKTRLLDRCIPTSLSYFSPEAVAATAANAATVKSEEELIRRLVCDYVPTQRPLWQCPMCYLPMWEGPTDRTDINSGPGYVHVGTQAADNFFHYATKCQCPCRTEFLCHVFPTMMKVEWIDDVYDDVGWMDTSWEQRVAEPVSDVPAPKRLLCCPRCTNWVELEGRLGHTGPDEWHPVVRTAHSLHWCTLEGDGQSLWCIITADSRLWEGRCNSVLHMVTFAFSPAIVAS